jgi:hypothetical protein
MSNGDSNRCIPACRLLRNLLRCETRSPCICSWQVHCVPSYSLERWCRSWQQGCSGWCAFWEGMGSCVSHRSKKVHHWPHGPCPCNNGRSPPVADEGSLPHFLLEINSSLLHGRAIPGRWCGLSYGNDDSKWVWNKRTMNPWSLSWCSGAS